MDKVSNNSYLNYAQLYQQNLRGKFQTNPESQSNISGIQASQPGIAPTQPNNDFSSMFADDELSKLQKNLEAISQMADSILQTLEK